MKAQLLIPLIMLLSLEVSAAASATNTAITSVYCGYEGTYNMCSVVFDKPIINKDSCNTIDSNRMQFKGDGSMGRALLSIALTAYASNKKVNVQSTGSCSVYSGLSDVEFIEIIN